MRNRDITRIVGPGLVVLVASVAPHAHAQFYRDTYFEAECPDSGQGNYTTKSSSITGFSGTGYIRSAGNTTAATYNNTSADHAIYTFKAYRYGSFKPWFRINTNNSASDDSFFYRIDGGDWFSMTSIPAGSGWRWIGADDMYMGPGPHTLEIANREDGLNIDKLAMIYSGATPSGNGGPAYNCPTPLYFESECRSSAWGQYVWDKKAKTGFSGSGYLEAVTTNTDPNAAADEVVYPFESAGGAYNFFFRINNNANASNDSWFYRVDNGAWVTMNNTSGLGSGWRWAQGSAAVSLSRGDHTLRVKGREGGLSLDKLAFVPTTATGPSGTGTGSAAVNCEPFQTMADWDYFDVQAYYDTHVNYMTTYGAEELPMHVDWHAINGSGGADGPGSGIAFLGFHRAMMNNFRKFAMENGGRTWLPISTTALVIPPWLGDALQALGGAGFVDQYAPRVNDQLTNYGIPAYLTTAGTPSTQWPNNTVWVNNAQVTYTRIGDIPDLDSLGQAIGSEYHGSLHGAVGGTMSSFYSPADPIFYGWHGLIDTLADVWLATPNGKAWAAAHPDHPFLKVGFTSHENWDNADFVP